MMKRALVLAVAAGCVTSAAAQQVGPDRAFRQQFKAQKQSAWYLNGVLQTAGSFGSDDPTVVFGNEGGDAIGQYAATSSKPNYLMGDEGSFTPGPGAGGGFEVTGFKFAIAVEPASGIARTYEAQIRFFDDTDQVSDPLMFNQIGPTLVVSFVDPTDPGFVSVPIDFVDTTGLGLVFDDDTFGYEIRVVEFGTDVAAAFGTTVIADNFPLFEPDPGASGDFYMRDVNNDGKLGTSTELRALGGTSNNLYLAIRAEIDSGGCGCVCNYDTSTGADVCDFFDFIIFQDLFGASDPCGCELDTSTGTGVCDFFDFIIFQDLFSVGC